ncbi:MAG: SDR family NAD(P)-dependent oxidoreductase [Anaerolineae bacterium]|nr:SDR family NAD(P)-dependent oxidoreductase [Anaerolineae bacterium]
MILVTGATGNIGRELVTQLAQTGKPFSVMVRNAAKAQAMLGSIPNLKIVEGDVSKTQTLAAALEGVERAFLLTPSDFRQVDQQGNFINAAKAAGVKHIVKLSVVGAAPDAPTQLMRWHAQSERELEQSGIAWTHLRPHVFYQYWLQLVYPINMTGGFYASLAANVALPAIDIRDIATVAVRCLTEPGHEGKVYRLTGPEALTNVQVAEKIGKVMGKNVTYSYMPPEHTKAGMMQMGMQPWFVDFVVGMDEAYSTGRYSDVTYDFYRITGRQPISADQFFSDFGGFIKNPPQFDMSAFAGGAPQVNPEELKAKVIRLYDELNHNNFDVLYEIMDPHFTAHGETMGLDPSDKDHLAAVARGIQWAKWVFPDLYVSVDDLVAEGDKVAARLTWRGTVTQEVYGVPPNGQTIEWTGMAINRFENGKIVERWFNSDEMGMMRGMGLLPPMGGGAPAPAADAQPAAAPQTDLPASSPVGPQVSNSELEGNKAIVRYFYEHVFTEGHVEKLKDIMDESFEDHGEALFGSAHGRAMLEGGIAHMSKMFPVKAVEVMDMIAEGDLVGVRGVMTLVHSADWLGRAPTGKELKWNGLSIFRIKDGKIVARWFNSDSLYILEQLGYWPVNK